MKPRRWASVLLAATAFTATGAHAQYFGRNKVRYKAFRFEVLKTRHFDIYFYPEEREAVGLAARMAERWYARLARVLQHELTGPQPLILYASHPDFEQTNAIPGELGEATGGVTEALKRRIVLPLAGPLAETDHVLGHELVHAFQFDITGQGRGPAGLPTAGRLPLWFIEGMAEYLSLGPVDAHTAMWMRDALRHEKALPAVRRLDHPRYFPYRWGQALWAYIAGRWGEGAIGELLRTAAATRDVEGAFKSVLEISSAELSKDWHEALRAAYEPLAGETRPAREVGRRLVTGRKGIGDLNVSPAVSPDGRRFVFLSERGLFSIELFLADAATGRVTRKITRAALDPHLSSLQFLNSAGAWAPDGRRLLFAAVRAGRPTLVLMDLDRGRIEREIPFPQLGEIFGPTWSPDGRRVAFSALVGGFTDLFVYDLQTGELRRLTHDPFADVQPAWSPDGVRLAFVTDRFSTLLRELDYGNYRLALLDLASGKVELVPGTESGKNISPQWSPDGASLYFLSDRDGITDIYRLEVRSGALSQVTRLYTGASGITALSPALSVASQAGRLVVSVYEDGGYGLYAIDSPESLLGGPTEARAGASPAALPPRDRAPSELGKALREPSFGLPPPAEGQTSAYRARLSLDRVSQPNVAVGADRFGAFFGGGGALLWSDMLGDHSLVTAFQAYGDFKDAAAVAAYENLKGRWSWGAVAQQVPYVAGAFESGLAEVRGDPVVLERTVLFRQTNRVVAGVAAYPFSRAQRLELSAGYRNVSFEEETETRAFSLRTGQLVFEDRRSASLGRSLNLGEASAALVYDNAYFGATSPVLGQRYRFEVAPTIGSVQYQGLLADYRRYLMPAPLYTVALRVLHYGRYGRDAEDERLVPLFIGYPNLVRGYDTDTFSASECKPDPSGPCPVFDRLLGSRILVGNLELRFPLLRPFGLRQRVYGPLPAELALFTDAGVAWRSGERPALLGGERKAVASAGVALRVNAFGYAVLELAWSRPFQRPDKGWIFQFNLLPGF